MKSIISFIIIAMVGISLNSCKKCTTCQCWKDGNVYEEKNCAYGGGSSNQTLKTWEKYIEEEMAYDSIQCITE